MLEARGLSKSYGSVPALQNVSDLLRDAEFLWPERRVASYGNCGRVWSKFCPSGSVRFHLRAPIPDSRAIRESFSSRISFFVFTGYLPELEHWSLINPVRTICVVPLLGAVLGAARAYRRQMLEMDKQLIFEESASSSF
jgi:hypothetical protein